MASRKASWQGLGELALCYAAPGADIEVYVKNPHSQKCELVGYFSKSDGGPYLPPSCIRRGNRNVLASPLLNRRDDREFKDLSNLRRWDYIQDKIIEAIRAPNAISAS